MKLYISNLIIFFIFIFLFKSVLAELRPDYFETRSYAPVYTVHSMMGEARYYINSNFELERRALECKISLSMIKYYSDKDHFEWAKNEVLNRIDSFRNSLNGIGPTIDEYISKKPNTKIYTNFLTISHFIYGKLSFDFSWNFFFYPSLIKDSSPKSKPTSFLKKFWLFQNQKMQYKTRHENLQMAASKNFIELISDFNPKIINLEKQEMKELLNLSEQNRNNANILTDYIRSHPDNSHLKDIERELLMGNSNLIIQEKNATNLVNDLMFLTGEKPDELTKFLLSAEKESLTFLDIWDRAIQISSGDPMEALGLIILNLSFDAASNRITSSILNSKIKQQVFPTEKEFELKNNFNFQPGFNYHFWAHIAEGWFHNDIFLRSRSYVYENIMVDDPSKGLADRFGIQTATNSLSNFSRKRLPNYCNNSL